METTLNNGFYEMSQDEIMVTDGGRWGWVGLLQPGYDFLSGVWDGFKKPCKKCK